MQSVHAGAGFTRVGLRGKKVIPEVGMEANFREFCLILIYLGRSLAPKSDYVAAFERPEVGHAFRAALNMTQIHSQTARPKLWGNPPPPETEKGNALWHLPTRRNTLGKEQNGRQQPATFAHSRGQNTEFPALSPIPEHKGIP